LEEERIKQEKLRERERLQKDAEAARAQLDAAKRFQQALSRVSKPVPAKAETQAGPSLNTSAKEQISAMRQMAQRMEGQLQALPAEWRGILGERLSASQRVLADVKAKAFDLYHYQRLRTACAALEDLMLNAETIVADYNGLLAERRAAAEALIVKLKVVEANTTIAEQADSARKLSAKIEDAAQHNTPDAVLPDSLAKQAEQLIAEFEELAERQEARGYVNASMREVLTEMGYDVMDISDEAPDGPQPTNAYFRTPDNEAVQVGLGLDNSVYAEFKHLVGQANSAASHEQLVANCKKWCASYPELAKRLAERGINLGVEWQEAAEELNADNELVSNEAADAAEIEEQEDRRRRLDE
jgi:hypothetical protein